MSAVSKRPHPNLFTYATSELSQDAFLCWLVEWANPEWAASEPFLHKKATAFLRHLFSIAKPVAIDFPAVRAVEIRRQHFHADIVLYITAESGRQYAVIIEDKVNTKERGDQLDEYLKKICEYAKNQLPCFSRSDLVCIYYKTGDQSDYSGVEGCGYAVVKREDMIGILRPADEAEMTNAVYRDYYLHLCLLQEKVMLYESLCEPCWRILERDGETVFPLWIGLFKKLQEIYRGRVADCNVGWDYANPRSGRFIVFWRSPADLRGPDFTLYIQLEEGKYKNSGLCFKACWNSDCDSKEKRAEATGKLVEIGTDVVRERGVEAFVKRPNHIRWQKERKTFLLWRDYLVFGHDSRIDVEATFENMRRAEDVIEEIAKRFFVLYPELRPVKGKDDYI